MRNLEIERRFLITSGFSILDIPPHLITGQYEIRQRYLLPFNMESRRIRCKFDRLTGEGAYYLTEKRRTKNPRVRVEKESKIDRRDFEDYQREIDLECDEIVKVRICFKSDGQEFELDFFQSPSRLKNLAILEIEMKHPDQKVKLPDFIPIACEITGSLSNRELAKRLPRK
jgi:CYTH domain-containing protein